MKQYTYYFADGTKNTIEVEDKWYDILTAMDQEERKKNYNYDRHNYPLSKIDYEGESFYDPNANPFEEMMRESERKKIDEALGTLTEKQRELFGMVFYEGKKVTEIAEEQGVCHQAISARLTRIKEKMQKILLRP